MKPLINKIIYKVLALLLVALVITGYLLSQSSKEKNRLESNQISLLNEVKIYKSSDSLNAASVEKLTLTNREFKKYNGDLVKTVESLNLKVKRLQSISQTGIETKYEVSADVRDSITPNRNNPLVPDTIKCIKFKDIWLNLDGCIRNQKFLGIIESKDSLVHAVDRVPHKFLFFKYGTKAIRMNVVSLNPHSKITYAKYIEFKR
jgi:hypothetical protein